MIEFSVVLLIAVVFAVGYYIIYRFGRFTDEIEQARHSSFESRDDDNDRDEYNE